MRQFAKEIYRQRRKELARTVGSGILLFPGNDESPVNYPSNAYRFRQDSDFLYFFGQGKPRMAGWLDADSGESVLFGEDPGLDDIIWTGPVPSLAGMAESVGADRTAPLTELTERIRKEVKSGRTVHYLPPYRADNRLWLADLLNRTPEEVSNGYSEAMIRGVVSLREKKSSEEIREIEDSLEIAARMHTVAMKMCRPGRTEREIAGHIEGIALSFGAGISFPPIVTQHGEVLHNHDYNGTLEAGRMLLIDAGAETLSGYASDLTRTLPVSGKFSAPQRALYELVLSVHDLAFETIRPDIPYRDIHLQCAARLSEGLRDLKILKGPVEDLVRNGAYALLMPHGLGHQMGLDVHDMEGLGERYVGYNEKVERSAKVGLSALRMGRQLIPGHVLTVEPGVYFIPALIEKWRKEGNNREFIDYDRIGRWIGFGGIRIENDALVTEHGCRMLGKTRVPVTPDEIEEAMAG